MGLLVVEVKVVEHPWSKKDWILIAVLNKDEQTFTYPKAE
jgi:hypothetical protein